MKAAPGARGWWWLYAASALTSGVAIMVASGFTARRLGAEPGQNPLAVVSHVETGLMRLGPDQTRLPGPRITWLGDSTVASHAPGETLPERLELLLGPGARVANLAYPAMTPPEYYHLAGRIALARPDLVIWQTSLSHLSASQGFSAMRRGLAGWQDWRGLLELQCMPIERIGLTLDQLLLYKGVVALGGVDAWRRLSDEQSRVAGLRQVAERALAGISGAKPEDRFRKSSGWNYQRMHMYSREGRKRYTAVRELEHYGPGLGGLDDQHLVLRALRSGLLRLRAAGIPVLVYLNPINLDNLRHVGVLDEAELERSVGVFRSVVQTSGATFVDLHQRFPDRYFSDAAGHFGRDDEIDAPAELIEALLAPVRTALGLADGA